MTLLVGKHFLKNLLKIIYKKIDLFLHKNIFINIISMNNIEKYVDNFENAYEKVSERLMNIDDEIHPNFDSLNDIWNQYN